MAHAFTDDSVEDSHGADRSSVPRNLATEPRRPTNSIVRAIFGGLLLGALGAALIFVVASWNNSHSDCEFPDTEQCNFELSTADEVARMQAFAAIGFALVSGGLYLVWRRP